MILNSPTISGSLTVTGNTTLSGSINVVGGLTGTASFASSAISSSYSATATSSSYALATTSASYSATATSSSYALASTTASYGLNALTSSNSMTASSADTLYVRNNATVLGSITAQTLVVQTVTSSVLFTTGSNKIGSSLSNVQELTGSVGITGSLAVNGAATVSTTLSISDDFTLASTNPQIKWNAGNLRFTSLTAGNVMVTVNETGSVGIGTTAPQATLDVRGKYYAIANIADNIVEVINSDSTNGYGLYVRAGGTATNRYVARFKNGADTDVMWLDKSGNVGIGTTSPQSKLSVSNGGALGIEFDPNTSSGTIADIFAYNRSTSAYKPLRLISEDLRFLTGTSPTEKMRLDSSGNLGLGTTAPTSKFVVAGTGDLSYINNTGSSTTDANFYIYNSTKDILMVRNSGNVGIGTASPYALLSVYSGSAGDRILIDSNSGSGSNGGIAWGAGSLPNISARIRGIDDGGYGTHLLFETRGNGATGTTTSERMRITSGGNVGIGASTAPVYKLEVSTSSGSERIRVGTLQNNSNTATFEAITSSTISSATSGWIRAVYGGGLAIGTSTYTKTGGDSGNFANLSSEAASTAITVNGGQTGIGGALPKSVLGSSSKLSVNGGATMGANGTSNTSALNLDIAIDALDGGLTLLFLASRNTADGTSTGSAVYIISFYYNGSNFPTISYLGGTNNFVSFGSSGGKLTATNSAGGNVNYSWFASK